MRMMTLLALPLLAAGLAGCTADPPVPAPEPVNVSVFLRDDITEPERQAVEAAVRAVPGASGVAFESREQAYARFQELFADSPELVESVTPESLPESFRLTVADRAAAEPALAELRRLPGVDQVTVPAATPSPPAGP